MRMNHRPLALSGLALAGLLVIPLLALNIAVHDKTQFLKIFSRLGNIRLLAFMTAWTIINCIWIARARWIGFWSSGLMMGLILYTNAYLLLTTKNYGLAFFAMGLLIITAFHGLNLYQTLSLVYFDSGRRWYEQYPRFLPGLTAMASNGEHTAELRLSSLSQEGCFAYTEQISFAPKQVLLRFHKNSDQEVNCTVELVARTNDNKGLGLMFLYENPDQWIDLNEFIDRARSYGYA